jgi:phosphopantothenoylcysteine synthetase/decarboxylase
MNEQMYWHPAVQRNLAQLQQDGVFVVGPGVSRALVDGRAGPPAFGALGAVDEALLELLESVLAAHSQRSERTDAQTRGAA